MVRNVLGSLLALVGAAAAALSPFRAWYDDHHGREYRLGGLFSAGDVTAGSRELLDSLFLPFVAAAALTLVALLLRSRLLVAAAGVAVLGLTVLWMVRVGQTEGRLVAASDGSGLRLGVAGAAGGGVLLLLAALVMSGRRARRGQAPEPERQYATADDGQGLPPGYEQREPGQGPDPYPPQQGGYDRGGWHGADPDAETATRPQVWQRPPGHD